MSGACTTHDPHVVRFAVDRDVSNRVASNGGAAHAPAPGRDGKR